LEQAAGTWSIDDSGSVYAKDVTITNSVNSAGTIYAMSSTDGTGNTGWDFTETIKTWDGGASTAYWNDGNNWNPDGVPDGNDAVTINSTSANLTVETNGDISFGTLIVGGDTTYTNQLNIGRDDDVNNTDVMTGGDLTIFSNGTVQQNNDEHHMLGNDLVLSGTISGDLSEEYPATLTHKENSTYPADNYYNLFVDVGGDVETNSYAYIDVTGKGFSSQNGPGYFVDGSTYGGQNHLGTGATYGSIDNPTDLGSGGGNKHGGGAVIIAAGGTFDIAGSVLANGQLTTGWGSDSGTGGSINLSAEQFIGNGVINANCGTGYDSGEGSGGRVSLKNGETFSFTGEIMAKGIKDHFGTVSLSEKIRDNFKVGGGFGPSHVVFGTDDKALPVIFGDIHVYENGNMQVSGNSKINNGVH